jgi:hypothetical protein
MADRARDREGRPRFDGPRDRFGRPLPPGSPDELTDRVDPEEAELEPVAATRQALRLFSERRFFEAHEHFEYLWKHPSVATADREVWRALAQVAVGLCHVQRGNERAAAVLLDRAVVGLERAEPAARQREALIRWARSVRTALGTGTPSPSPPPV